MSPYLSVIALSDRDDEYVKDEMFRRELRVSTLRPMPISTLTRHGMHMSVTSAVV